jgi:transposase
MPKSHPPYSPEFRQRIVELVRKGRTPEELARQFKPSAQAIRNWVKQAALDAGEHSDGLTTAEHDELRRLRREVRQLVGDPVGQGIVASLARPGGNITGFSLGLGDGFAGKWVELLMTKARRAS